MKKQECLHLPNLIDIVNLLYVDEGTREEDIFGTIELFTGFRN